MYRSIDICDEIITYIEHDDLVYYCLDFYVRYKNQ